MPDVLPFRRSSSPVHWAVWITGPGVRLVANAGCQPDARLGVTSRTAVAKVTDNPERVTCRICKALPSYRRAVGLA